MGGASIGSYGGCYGVFSPDGLLVATVENSVSSSVIYLWDAATGALVRTLQGHSYFPRDLDFSHDGSRLLSGSLDGTAKIWDVSTGTLLHTLPGHPDGVVSVAFSYDDSKVATNGQYEQFVRQWSAVTGEESSPVGEHTYGLSSAFLMPDASEVCTVHCNGWAAIWDIETETALRTFQLEGSRIVDSDLSPDGSLLATAAFETSEVVLWETSTGTRIRSFGGPITTGRMAFSKDGTRLAVGGDNVHDDVIRIWNVQTGSLVRSFMGHSTGVLSLRFSNKGNLLATGGRDRTIRIWDAATGALLGSSSILDNIYNGDIQFSSDDSEMVITGGKGTYVLSSSTLAVIDCLSATPSYSVGFHPMGNALVIGHADTSASVWSFADRTLLGSLNGHAYGGVATVQFSIDGAMILTGGGDGTTILWDSKFPSMPLIEDVTVEPSVAYTDDTLTAVPRGWQDVHGHPPGYIYEWRRNGTAVTGATGLNLTGSYFAKGDSIVVEVTPFDGTSYGVPRESNPLVISNSPPTPPVVQLLPANPQPGQALVVDVIGYSTDPDGDSVGYFFRWYECQDFDPENPGAETWIHKVELDGSSQVSGLYIQEGELWRFELIPYETAGGPSPEGPEGVALAAVEGEAGWDQVYIGNNERPTITVTKPALSGGAPSSNNKYTIEWDATDADGDPLLVDIYYDKDTVKGGSTLVSRYEPDHGTYIWNTASVPDGDYYIFARVMDNKGAIGDDFSAGRVTIRQGKWVPESNVQDSIWSSLK